MLNRSLTKSIVEALKAYPIVVLEGMRDVGKTTLAKSVVDLGVLSEYRSFQNSEELAAAKADPRTYLESLKFGTVIDEAQLVEEITLPMKAIVDEDPEPGRFLLTGSERLSRRVMGGSDPLAGRSSLPFRLPPLTVAEQNQKYVSIADSLFEIKFLNSEFGNITKTELIQYMLVGGMPRLYNNPALVQDKKNWAVSYLRSVLDLPTYDQRDIRALGSLFTYISGQTSQLINLNTFGAKTGIDKRTVKEYVERFESTFLINRIPGWRSQAYKSETEGSKVHIADTGLACSLGGLHPQSSLEDLGKVTETFVANELIAQSNWSESNPNIYHWRDSNRHEVDFILESGNRLVCVEVKSSTSIDEKSFRSIKAFQKRYSERFIAGYVFYMGDNILPFGENFWALPMSYLVGAS